MAAPRLQAPDSGLGSTGNPILDSANAVNTDDIEGSSLTLENNRPSQPSPLKSSLTAADLDTAYPASAVSGGSSSTASTTSDSSSGIKQDSTVSTSAAQHAQEDAPVENVLSAIGGAVV